MLSAQAQLRTDRASRYLIQFCRHVNQMDKHPGLAPTRHTDGSAPPTVEHVAWSQNLGVVRFGRGTWVLQATEDTLRIYLDAADQDVLQRLTDGITRRLLTIGRRQLTITWQRPDTTEPDPSAETSPAPARRHRSLIASLLLGTVAALVIVVHLGLLSGVLAPSAWAKWSINLVLALVVIKVLTVGGHLLLGRIAIRRALTLAAALRAAPWARRRLLPDPLRALRRPDRPIEGSGTAPGPPQRAGP